MQPVEDRNQGAHRHGDAAHPGNRAQVDLALVRDVDEPQPDRQVPQKRGQGDGGEDGKQ